MASKFTAILLPNVLADFIKAELKAKKSDQTVTDYVKMAAVRASKFDASLLPVSKREKTPTHMSHAELNIESSRIVDAMMAESDADKRKSLAIEFAEVKRQLTILANIDAKKKSDASKRASDVKKSKQAAKDAAAAVAAAAAIVTAPIDDSVAPTE